MKLRFVLIGQDGVLANQGGLGVSEERCRMAVCGRSILLRAADTEAARDTEGGERDQGLFGYRG